MIVHEPTVPLGRVDCRALADAVLALDEAAWRADPRRQQDFDVHAQTDSIILLFCDGWPDVAVTEGPGWPLLSVAAAPVIDEIVAKRYPPGGRVLRSMMARLGPGRRIARHKDSHPSFSIAHRIHVPLVTNPGVEFVVGPERVPPRAGFAFELNNLMLHHVINNGDSDRIHFIFDYAPPAQIVS